MSYIGWTRVSLHQHNLVAPNIMPPRTSKTVSEPKDKRIDLRIARQRLITVWLLGSAVPFLLLMLQSMRGKYGKELQQVWSWFLPTVFPTAALMIGVMGAVALIEARDKRTVDSFFLQLATFLSTFYILALWVTMLSEALGGAYRGMELYSVSNYWLTPLQGLSVAAVTILFATQENESQNQHVATSPKSPTRGR